MRTTWHDDFWEEAEPSDLPGELEEIAHLLGIEAARELMEHFSGAQVYVPSIDSVTKAYRDKRILMEYNGRNMGKLAKRYGLTRRYIEQLVREGIRGDQGELEF